jgi:dihydroorotate dehydrogenase
MNLPLGDWILGASERAWWPVGRVVRGPDAQVGHARAVRAMRRTDGSRSLVALARRVNRVTFPDRPTSVGGVTLPHPIILAAGLVKGDGFASEEESLAEVRRGRDIVPGWRSVPALVGAVEFGSYTRAPRPGNQGRVLWRDDAARSMQNRIGLRNPGAAAAAAFLASVAGELPPTWGVSLAASPGVDDLDLMAREIAEAAGAFERAFGGHPRSPAWFTLNLSCPNTEDDPHGRQTEVLARRLADALRGSVRAPVWAKVGPDLSDDQLAGLVSALTAAGIRAIVATNTVARPAPGGEVTAGLSGAPLRPLALGTVARLQSILGGVSGAPDIVACGGILEGVDLRAFTAAGARAAMIYSALVFRGPLAAALILREADRARHD